MMKTKPTLKVTEDFTEEFNALIKRFKNDSVLVGIPADKSAREGDSEITNAAILAINHFGSPANNIPPRQPMTVGIKNAQEPIAEQFKLAATTVLKDGLKALDKYYDRAGSIAANAVKKAINDQEFGTDAGGPADSTKRARKAAGFKGTKSLVVTGQTRNAITWVVKR